MQKCNINKIKTVYSVGTEYFNLIKKHAVICKAINIYVQYVLSPESKYIYSLIKDLVQRKFIYEFINDLVQDRISEDNYLGYI